MKDYFKVLKVDRSATLNEVKEAYRKLAMEHHPDKGGDADRFKEIAEAYEWICNNKKENKSRGGFKDFEDFNEFFRNGKRDFNSKKQRPKPDPNCDHLNISINKKISLREAILGVKINCTYEKIKVKILETGIIGKNFVLEKEEKEIIVNLNLTKKHIALERSEKEYVIRVNLPKLGNEDYVRYVNMFDEVEPIHLVGDLILNISIEPDQEIELDGGNIIQKVQVPLYKILKGGEKIRIETVFNKKYDAEITQPVTLNNLKLVIDGQGIMKNSGELGNYVIVFEALSPNISKLKKSERDQFLNLLKDI
jgi:DnaJ-class molecular chaperone